MAARCIEMGVVAVLMAMMWGGAAAQLGCTSAIVGLTPCINYVTGNSSTPAPSCCSQLASVVSSQPQCLCAVLSGGSSSMLGFTLNQTQALNLPTACNVKTPPASQCNAASGPATAPAEAPAAAATAPSEPPSASAPATTSAPSLPSDKPLSPTVPSPTQPSAASVPGNASKTVPSTSKNTSGAASTAIPLSLLIVLFLASQIAIF